MQNDRISDQHVGERLSGYLDGELTQQERQRIDLHLESCEKCTKLLGELAELRTRMSSSAPGGPGEDRWRESMDDDGVRLSRGIGWVLVIAAAIILGGVAVVHFIADPGVDGGMKLLIGGLYLGLAALFVSVLRQRLIESKTDKYKDVEI
jgi:anti-sigma factor RsiW